jgi:hypothetical protein
MPICAETNVSDHLVHPEPVAGTAALIRQRRHRIDNSADERALRGIAICRRNYLFSGADSGGERAIAIFSLIGTAMLSDRPRRLVAPCAGKDRRSSRQPR